jgi:hypothetical protein
MNQQENPEPMNQVVEIEDLTVEVAAQNEVKGGADNLLSFTKVMLRQDVTG